MDAPAELDGTMSGSTTSPTGPRSEESRERRSRGTSSRVFRYVRTGLNSGLFAGIAGVITLLRARRALREGSSDSATRQSTLAVFWIGVAMTQWGMNRSSHRDARAAGVDASEVVNTAPDVEAASSGSDDGDATPIDVTERNPAPDVEGGPGDSDVSESDVVDTGPDPSDVGENEDGSDAEDSGNE